jgi:hypothetical protein
MPKGMLALRHGQRLAARLGRMDEARLHHDRGPDRCRVTCRRTARQRTDAQNAIAAATVTVVSTPRRARIPPRAPL